MKKQYLYLIDNGKPLRLWWEKNRNMSNLKTLKIENYKGFYEEQIINFAIPNGKDRSGLTLVVGPNNTGKTTIIEALAFTNKKRFEESDRHGNDKPKITFEFDDGKKIIYTNLYNGSQVIENEENGVANFKFDLIQSRRNWNIETSAGEIIDEKRFLEITSATDTRDILKIFNRVGLVAILNSIVKTESKKRDFDELLKQIIPNLSDWTIDTNNNNDFVKYISKLSSHSGKTLGDWILSLFRICVHLILSPSEEAILIDEPELSLHPNAQKELLKILSNKALNKQILICTHSPYFVDWNNFKNGSKIIRLNKHDDEKCKITFLDNEEKYSKFIGRNIDEWQKPQMLDIVSKELLFSDKILFVEGQEDVGLIRKWGSENNINFNFEIFGYGVGSYSNMNLFLEMAQDLGLKKVGALYDSGKDADESYGINKSKYSNYLLHKLTTQDIRDKNMECEKCGRNEKIKEGCFDKHGVLKEGKKEEFNQIMNEFIKFYKS